MSGWGRQPGIDWLGELEQSFNLSERQKPCLKRTEIEMLCTIKKKKKVLYRVKAGGQNI
jgi:hypothetical protein